MASIFQSQLMSLIVEGVFEQFPGLRVVLAAGGVTWLPSLIWRLDKEWKGLRREIPWVRQLPSEYIRRHVRLTLQPADVPPAAVQWQQMFDQLEGTDLLLFGSDYPYCSITPPEQLLPASLSDAARRRILAENARAFYRLPDLTTIVGQR
jgi:predicted TIM-barrel fold metal-dependent hydrolase